jgi:drug/metabolite transporter (DMT)-like permease
MLVSALFFGAMAVAARAAARTLPGPEVAFARFAVGAAGVAAIAVWRPRSLLVARPGLLTLRGLLGGLTVVIYFIALERLGAGLGTLLNNTYPLWAALFAAFFLKEPLTSRVLTGLPLTLAGLVIVVGPSEIRSALHETSGSAVQFGLLCGLAAGVTGGASTTIIHVLRRTDSALAVFGAFCLGGLIVSLPPALHDWRAIHPSEAGLLFVVGLLSLVAQMLFTYAMKYVSASGSVTNTLTVVASYVMAAMVLGEPIATHVVAGGAVVIAGIMLATS